MNLLDLSLIHINDTHSHFDPSRVGFEIPSPLGVIKVSAMAGGYSMIDTYVQQLRKASNERGALSLFVDAGDTFEGSLYFSCFHGLANADLYNEMGLEYMAIGNHEFDSGDEKVAAFIKAVQFPVLASNLIIESEQTPLAQGLPNLYCQGNPHQASHYRVHSLGDVSIGIIALSLENMRSIASPSEALHFAAAAATARQCVSELHEQGIMIIVLLSHLGIETDRQLAAQVEGLSVIVGGHSHILQGDFSYLGWERSVDYGDSNPKTPIVQAGFNAAAVGHIRLQFDGHGRLLEYTGGNTLLVDPDSLTLVDSPSSDAEQAELLELVNTYLLEQTNVAFPAKSPRIEAKLDSHYRPALTQFREKNLGYVRQSLRHVRLPDEQGGSLVAPLVAKSFIDYALEKGVRADVGLINAGAIRSGLAEGTLTQADVAGQMLPFPISLQSFNITGKALTVALHQAAVISVNRNGASGSYPYLANLRVHSPLENHPTADSIVVEVLNEYRQWEPLDPHRLYRVVTTSYVAQGKEGFVGFASTTRNLMDFSVRASDVFAWFAQRTLTDEPVALPDDSYVA
jgi:5'-nucleotidase